MSQEPPVVSLASLCRSNSLSTVGIAAACRSFSCRSEPAPPSSQARLVALEEISVLSVTTEEAGDGGRPPEMSGPDEPCTRAEQAGRLPKVLLEKNPAYIRPCS